MANEPKMKIGIGADTGDFDKGAKKVKGALKELGIDANSAAGKLASSFGKATVAFAGVVAAAKLVGKALKDLKDQNQVLADSWGRTCEGMKGAFENFKSALVSLDFTNLISNMSEAARLAQDMYNATDAMGEITTAYNIGLAQQLGKIDELRLKMKDTSLSEQERVAAGQELLRIYKQLEKNPTRGLGRVSDTTIDYYMKQMGVNMENRTDAELKAMRKKYIEFFKWLGTAQGESVLSQVETIVKSGGLDSYWGKTALANARKLGLEENLRLAYAYSTKMNDKDRQAIEQAVVAYLQQENKFAAETFRIRKDIQAIQNEGAAAAAKASEESAKAAKIEADNIARVKAAQASLTSISSGSPLLNQVAEIPVKLKIPEVEKLTFKHLAETELAGIQVEVGFVMDSTELNNIAQQAAEQIKSVMVNTLESLTESIGTLLGDLATGKDGWNDFANSAVQAFGDMAVAIGKIAIEAGTSVIALKAAMGSMSIPGAYLAIAAGMALVALGSAVKAGMANIAAGNYSGGGIATSSSSSSIGGDYESRDVNVNVTGTLQADGDQLVAVINNSNKKSYYTT